MLGAHPSVFLLFAGSFFTQQGEKRTCKTSSTMLPQAT
jgi:hypothetical protein